MATLSPTEQNIVDREERSREASKAAVADKKEAARAAKADAAARKRKAKAEERKAIEASEA